MVHGTEVFTDSVNALALLVVIFVAGLVGIIACRSKCRHKHSCTCKD